MKNAIKKQLLGRIAMFVIAGTMVVGQTVGGTTHRLSTVSADQAAEEIVYYDDLVDGDDIFHGLGTHYSSTYTIPCDEMVTVSYAVHMSAPAFWKLNNDYMQNYCGAMAGRNVLIFYDRWLTNLVPNYTPGGIAPNGTYCYYPDLGQDATEAALVEIYDRMQIGTVGGTTSNNFKNGLSDYATAKGYSASYSSFYDSTTSVNLNLLTTAINQNKVGVVMCSQYNFVYSILLHENNNTVQVAKMNSTTAHMMMVYGYQTIAFYNDGNHVCTKTFLLVSSGFGDGAQGYMEMNDFSVINESVIISIV